MDQSILCSLFRTRNLLGYVSVFSIVNHIFHSPEIKPERPPPPTESDVLFCGNVGDESTVDSITEFFDKAGGVTQVRRPEGRPFAFIEFESMDACAKALEELQDQELDGQVPRLALA